MAERLPPAPGPRPADRRPPAPTREHAVDTDRSPYEDIVATAREQGRVTLDGINFDGLAWSEGDLHYRVTHHTKVEADTTKILARRHATPAERKKGIFGVPVKTETTTDVKWLHTVEAWKVDRMTGGLDLVSLEAVTDQELEEHFSEASGEEGPGVGDWELPTLGEMRPARTATVRSPLSFSNPEETLEEGSVIEEIDQQRWSYHLNDWVGLTWGNKVWGGSYTQHRIVADHVLQEIKDGKRQPSMRIWTIETTEVDEDGRKRVIKREDVDGVELQGIMEGVIKDAQDRKHDPARHDPYLWFETPRPEIPRAGRRLTRRGEAAAASDENRLSLDEAVELLSFGDVLNEREREQAKRELEDDPATRRNAEMLRELVADIGIHRVFRMAAQLHRDYIIDAQKLDLLTTDPTSVSASWPLLELARLHHYTYAEDAVRSRAPASINGEVGLVDLFAGGDRARNKQREILDRRIGREFCVRALPETKKPDMLGLREEDGEVKRVAKLKPNYKIHSELTKRLQPFIKARIVQKILTPTEQGKVGFPELTEWLTIGRLLRESIGR